MVEKGGTPAAQVKPSSKDIAWAAGLIEGEGAFDTRRNDGRAGCAIRVAQVNQEPLLRLQKLFGGSIKQKKAHSTRANDYGVWGVSGPRARGIAMTIYTFMSEKRREQLRALLSDGVVSQ